MNQTSGRLQNGLAAPYDFSIGEVLSEAWSRVHGMKATIWGAFGYLFLFMLGFAILHIIISLIFPPNLAKLLNAIVQGISGIVLFPMSIGLIYLGMRRAVDLPIQANQIFSTYHYFWKLIGLLVLQYAFLFVMMILFILTLVLFPPANTLSVLPYLLLRIIQTLFVLAIFYINFSFMFSFLLVIEKKLGIWAAFKASFFAFNQHGFKIIVLFFVMLLIYAVSILLLFVGVIWTLPMIFNVSGILYRIAFGVDEVKANVA